MTSTDINIENELSALSSPCFTEVWLDEPGVIMVCRSVVMWDTDPQIVRIREWLTSHGYRLTETFPDDDAEGFIAGRAVGEAWENR